MEGESRRGGDATLDGYSAYMSTVAVMEEMLDKLKLLNYESEFCKKMGFRYLSRYIFYNFLVFMKKLHHV
jgi:hypothetical protein